MIKACALDIAVCYISKLNPNPARMLTVELIMSCTGMEVLEISRINVVSLDLDSTQGQVHKREWKSTAPTKDFPEFLRVAFQAKLGQVHIIKAVSLEDAHSPQFDPHEDAIKFWEEFWGYFWQCGEVKL
jgi:hypothetical protein